MIRTLLAALLLAGAAPALAWSQTGHRVTGAIRAATVHHK